MGDVGSPVLDGDATYHKGVFRIDGAGVDVWGDADQFTFVYQRITGDVDIRARIDDVDGGSAYAKAGVMIRASLSPASAHAFSHVTVGAGVRAVRRLATGDSSVAASGTTAGAPRWVRVVRKGSTVTTYWSSSGSSWATITSETISLGSSPFVGIAVNSRNAHSRATARVSGVTLYHEDALPSGQESADIGGPSIRGNTMYSGGRYTIKAGGVDIWDSADEFHYVYQPVTGNVEVIARVNSITEAHPWSKAGVMIRESLAANSRHATTLVSAKKGLAFQRRPEPGAWTDHTWGHAGRAPEWVKLVRIGDTFESYRSNNGTHWKRIDADVIPMGDTVFVGIAVTSHNPAKATIAEVDGFKVRSAPATGNDAPVVSITAPDHGTKLTAPATITVAATATDPEGRLMSVDFYVGSTLIATDTTAPYATTWTATDKGTYLLRAVAHDADGGSSTSSAVSVVVKNGSDGSPRSNPPKKISFVRSVDHFLYVARYALKVFAPGADVETATPVAMLDLGKLTPSPITGEIVVDCARFFRRLPKGTYQATVTAVGYVGEATSASVTFTR